MKKSNEQITHAVKNIVAFALVSLRFSGLNSDDLTQLKAYFEEHDALMPLLDPTAYRDFLQQNGDTRLKMRVGFLESLLALADVEGVYIDDWMNTIEGKGQ